VRAVISAIALPEREDNPEGVVESSEVASVEALRLLGVLETNDDADKVSEDLLREFSGAETALLKEWLRRLGTTSRKNPGVRLEDTDEETEEHE
jgi:hypothetical protein